MKLKNKYKGYQSKNNCKSREYKQYYWSQKENVLKLKEVYDVDVAVESSEEIKPGKFKLEILKTYE